MNDVLWMFALVLAVVFLIMGAINIFNDEAARNRLDWINPLPRPVVIVIGLFEILAALGLVLPALLHLYVWLVPYAAIGLALLMFMVATFHSLRRDYQNMAIYVLLLLLAAFVGYGRLVLLPLS